jgi:geranylgeranyl diphosphate synthase type II
VTTVDRAIDVEAAAPDVTEGLRAYGEQVRDALTAAVPDGEPAAWLYDLVRDYPTRPAKFIRPALCLAACEAFGGSERDSLGPAIAIELLHNAFLVHDDVADGSLLRRGDPTLHARHGVGLAVNAGDALAVLANRVLRLSLDCYPAGLADLVAREFETMLLRTVEGQAIELGWRRDAVFDLTPEDYLDLIMRKTCWYTTIHPLRVGALVGSHGGADVSEMIRFGFYLGAAFQIRDDLLNLVGDEGVYGKEILGDLHEGKRTLMLIHLLGLAEGADRAVLADYLRVERDERSVEVVADVRSMMDDYGSIDFAADYATGIADAALDAFDEAFTEARRGRAYEFVRALVPYMLERTS